jgi:hypothetical protein
MHLKLTGFPLDPVGAQSLREMLGNNSSLCAEALIAHIIDLGGAFAVIEDNYTDKDYSADYQNFYAGAFKDYPRCTKRVHIFSEDVGAWFDKPFAEQASDTPPPDGGKSLSDLYLGFVVVRPIRQGPIGRTVLKFPKLKDGLFVRPAARADFNVHLLGTKLKVSGAPFIQQDRRIGACAQAAIWMAARAVHARHNHTHWHSIAEITELATTPTDAELSLDLPAGSTGLNPIHMIRALKGMGHQPLFQYFGEKKKADCNKDENEGSESPATDPPPAEPAEVIFRYLDSGLPVIVGMTSREDNIAHAIAAVGYVEVTGARCRPGATYDTFVRAFVVHDDQRGAYRYMPLTDADIAHLPNAHLLKHGDKVLTADKFISHIFVPLPSRVYLRAENADIVARDFLDQQVGAPISNIADMASDPNAKQSIRDFHQRIRDKNLVRRTYLTSAGRYRHHFAKGSLNEMIKSELITRQLPHFVWVTELMDPDAAQTAPGGPRPILGHIVINATSSGDPDTDLLAAHYPHVLVHNDMNPAHGKPDTNLAQIYVDDAPYPGRIRGH